MSGQDPPFTVTFHLSPNMLWQASRGRCECGYASAAWVATLYFDDLVMAQRTDSSLLSVLRSVDHWRTSVTRSHAVTQPTDPPLDENRRVNAPERRKVPRGGRRSRDPRH